MKKFPALLIAALVATCAFAAAAATADPAEQVESTVTIKFAEGGGTAPYYEEDAFKGKVKAKHGCKKDRTVKVFKEGGGLVGKDDTNERGRYEVPAVNPHGDFFAKAKGKKIEKNNGEEFRCKRAKSDTITVP